MNQENMVRIHLKQAILVDYGKEPRYAKVLVGEQQVGATKRHDDILILVRVIGYVWGYKGHTLDEPTTHLLLTHNILSIEYVKIERARCERRHCHRVTVMAGTPETLWAPGPRQVSLTDVDRARRIIQLREDGTYRIVKDTDPDADFTDVWEATGRGRPYVHDRRRDEVIFLYDEEN